MLHWFWTHLQEDKTDPGKVSRPVNDKGCLLIWQGFCDTKAHVSSSSSFPKTGTLRSEPRWQDNGRRQNGISV